MKLQLARRLPSLVVLTALSTSGLTLFAATDFYNSGPGVGAPDGMCDVWQSKFGAWGLAPSGDEDKDGGSNLIESIAGTDPRDPMDCYKVGNTSQAGNNVVFTFVAEAGKRYAVFSSSTPTGPWTEEASNVIPSADNPTQTLSVTRAVGNSKFYRLEAKDVDSDNDGVSDWAERQTGTNPGLATTQTNASGGTATDGATMASLLSLTAAPVAGFTAGFERVDRTAASPVSRVAKVQLVRSVGTMALTVPLSGVGGALDATKSNASAADFSLAASATIPENGGTLASPFEVSVNPVPDAALEVPEYLRVKVGLPGIATATGPSAVVCICDSDPALSENRRLYVAYLGREAGATTTASGIATALVAGDNESASVALTFSNLSSLQNTAYIRINADQDVDNLGLGQVSGHQWPIRAAHNRVTDQAMLDALQQGNVYVDVTTENSPNGEILGYFGNAVGSTSFNDANPGLVAPALGSTDWQNPTGEALEREIWRFMSQCTWGGTQALYDQIYAKVQTAIAGSGSYITGLSAWLDDQMNPALTPTVNFRTLVMAGDNEDFLLRGNKPITYTSDPQINGSTYTVTFDAAGNPTVGTAADTNRVSNNYPISGPNRRREWWAIVLQGKDQLRQRMTQALSEITVISEADQTVSDRHYGCANYWDMLAENAFGQYRTLLEKVSYSPMMGVYLTSISNRALYDANGGVGSPLMVSPDENYAREIMQLFSIGLVLRHPDGSLVLDASGLPIPTYDNNDITELARVMTGFSHGAQHAVGYVNGWNTTSLTNNPGTSQRVSDLVLTNGSSVTNSWFGRQDGHLYWAAPWITPMKLIGRLSPPTPGFTTAITYHDFNQYVDPATSTPVANVSKRLLAGKHGQYDIPMRTGLPTATGFTNDAAWHAAAVLDMGAAHDVLAGNPANSSYGLGTQASPGHQNTPVNISRWLIQRLVTSNPSAGYIYRVQQAYRNTNGNLGAVVKAILLDYEARSLQLADNSIAQGKVKEPLVAFASMLRALRAFSGSPLSVLKDNAPPFSGTDSPLPGAYPATEFAKFDTSNANPPSLPNGWATGPFRFRFNDLTGNLAQSPQRPPSVFNWFLPDYVVPGPMAEAGLYAPELQISTESGEVAKANMFYAYTWSNLTGMTTQPGSDTSISDFLLSNNLATPAVRFSLDGGVTFVNSLTFTPADYATPRTITAVAANTDSFTQVGNGTLRFSLSGAGSGYDAVPVQPINIALTDNEVPNEGILALHTGYSTWVQEGGKTDTVTVRLASPPAGGGSVTVNVAATAGQVIVSPTSLTFDGSNWNTNQTVTVSAVADNTPQLPGAGGDTLTFTSVSAVGGYNNLTATVPVGVVENSVATGSTNAFDVLITETGGTTVVTENSTTTAVTTDVVDSYTIVLTKQPRANVKVTCAPNNPQVQLNSSGTTFATAGTAVTRVFTNANWNVAQTVLVRGNQDTSRQGSFPTNPMHNSIIVHSVAAAGGYAATSALQPVNVAINDDDCRIILSHVGNGETRVSEGGAVTDTITVALRTAPTADVTVNLGSSSVRCDPTNLVFTPTNFGPQTVTVTAVDDFVNEGIQRANLSPGAMPAPATATTALTGGAVSALTITNPGANYCLTPSVSFTAAPTGGTTATGVATISSAGIVTGVIMTNAGSGYTAAPSVTFGVPQNAPAVIIASGTSAGILDTNYNNEWGNTYNGTFTQLNVTILDNDNAGVAITQSGGSTTVTESGTTDDFSVALTQPPTSDVTVSFTPGAQVFLSGATLTNNVLTFTTSNWFTAQTVTVSGVNDTTVEGDVPTTIGVVVDSNDKTYYGIKTSVIPVTVIDNDLVPLTIGHTNIFTGAAEGGTAGSGGTPNVSDTFTVQLPKAPTATVTVNILFDSAQVSVSPSTLTFTTANGLTGGYNVNQTVTVTAVDDAIPEPTPHNTALRFAVSSTDPYYNNPAHFPVIIPIKDNDSPGFSIVESSGNSTPTEGGNDTYSIVLTKQPSIGQVVVIDVASPAPADLLVNATGTLNGCATTNASVNVTTTIPNGGLVVGTAISGTGIPTGAIVASIVSQTAFTLSAAATATNTNLTLTTNTVQSGAAAVTFNNTNWNTAQTITTTAVPDMIAEGREVVNVTNTINASRTTDDTFDALPGQQVVTFVGDQFRRNENLVIIPSGGSLRSGDTIPASGNTYVTEGDPATDSVDFYLATPPQVPVTVTLSANAQMGFSQSVFYFTPANWNVPQTVQVSAVDDTFNDTYLSINGVVTQVPQSQNITFNLSGDPGYNFITATTAVNILDNDSPAVKITQSGGITTTAEGGVTDTYSVVLTTPPNGNVVVNCISASTTVGQTVLPTTVTFNASNWNVPQTVTVTAFNDTTVEGNHQSNITHTINQPLTTDTTGYALPIANCSWSAGSTTITCPTTAGLAAGMAIYGTNIPANATISTIVNSTSITISAAPTVAGSAVALTATITGIQTVVNHITDNDNRIIVTPTGTDTRVHEDGSVGDSYSVVLRSAPTANVTITPATTGGFASQGLAISPATLVFTSANWATPQSFNLTGVDNGINSERARTVNITHTSASTDANFNAQSIHTIAVNALSKDNARVNVLDNPGTNENGNIATYRIGLTRAPTANVTITLAADSQLEIAPPVPVGGVLTYSSGATLTFTPADWFNYQTVTVRALDDTIFETLINTGSGFLHTGLITQTVTSTDPAYSGSPGGVPLVTIVDNEFPGVRITQSGGNTLLSEAGLTDIYDVVLSQAPAADVTIGITPDAQSTVSSPSLTFTSANWSTPQTVTVTAVNDATAENAHPTVISHGPTVSTDPFWNGVLVPSVTGTITDNDGAQLVVTQTGGSTAVTEGGAVDTFQLSLATAPTANVTVSLIPPTYIIPVPPYAKQYGYYTSDLAGSNQQKDRVVVDYTEIIQLYRSTFYSSLGTAYGGTGNIPAVPSEVNVQNAHWAACKAIVDKMDLWWCQGSLKAKYQTLIEPNQAAPVPLPPTNPRQVVLDCIYQINGGANSLGTSRYLPEIVFDPKNPPTGTFHDEIRDRARWAGYLMSTIMPGFVSH